MSKITLKAILMGTVFIAAVVFSAISFFRCEVLNGFGYILTALIPVTIWFLDDKENQERDDKFVKLKEEVKSYGMKLIDNSEWNIEKDKYVSSLKSGNKYVLMDDSKVIVDKEEKEDDDLDKIVSILGNDVISYE